MIKIFCTFYCWEVEESELQQGFQDLQVDQYCKIHLVRIEHFSFPWKSDQKGLEQSE